MEVKQTDYAGRGLSTALGPSGPQTRRPPAVPAGHPENASRAHRSARGLRASRRRLSERGAPWPARPVAGKPYVLPRFPNDLGKASAGTLAKALLGLLLFATLPAVVTSQDVTAPPASATRIDSQTPPAPVPQGFLEIVFSGGLTGFLIVLLLLGLSICAAALVIEHLMSIRGSVLMPNGLAEQVQTQLLAGSTAHAQALCRQQPSFLAFVLQAGIAEVDGGWTAVEKAMEDAAAEQSARLFRKIEYLSVIANIAPMVGLLGTVIGMIFAFQEVAATQGQARAADLATGIYQALVTTVGGLLVAIPALAAFAIFRNRVDQLVAEGSYMAQHVFAPLKRRRPQKRTTAANPAPPPPPA